MHKEEWIDQSLYVSQSFYLTVIQKTTLLPKLRIRTASSYRATGRIARVVGSNPTPVTWLWYVFSGLGKVLSIQCHTHRCMGKNKIYNNNICYPQCKFNISNITRVKQKSVLIVPCLKIQRLKKKLKNVFKTMSNLHKACTVHLPKPLRPTPKHHIHTESKWQELHFLLSSKEYS